MGAIITLGCWSYFQAPIMPFRPVVSDFGANHVLTEIPLKKEEKKAILAVLESYGEVCRETETSLWISPRLYFDRELRWNYTSKSR